MLKTPLDGALLGVEMFRKCAAAWLQTYLEVEMFKEVHAIVVRNSVRSQHVQKSLSSGALLDVEVLKLRTPL